MQNNKNAKGIISQISMIAYLSIIFVLLHCDGLPGQYVKVFGTSLDMLFKLIAFLAQIISILFSTADNIIDIKLLDMKAKYWPIYFFLGFITILSMLVTNYPKREVVYCLNLIIHALFAVWMCEQYTAEAILEMAFQAQVVFVLASIIYPVLFPAYYFNAAREGVFLGCLGIKNESAAQLSFGITLQLILLRIRLENKRNVSMYFIGFLALQGILFLLTQGTGAIICVFVPVFYLYFIRARKGEEHRISLAYIYIIVSIGFLLFALTIVQMVAPFLESIGKDATLTGRTITWNKIIQIMQKSHTLTGYGYNMFWEDQAGVDLFHAGFNNTTEIWFSEMRDGAHNNIMELWLNVGLLGIAAYFFTLFCVFRQPERWSNNQYILVCGYILWLLVYGLTERSFFTNDYRTMFLFISLAVACNSKEDEMAIVENTV